jgi:hypothetical protein
LFFIFARQKNTDSGPKQNIYFRGKSGRPQMKPSDKTAPAVRSRRIHPAAIASSASIDFTLKRFSDPRVIQKEKNGLTVRRYRLHRCKAASPAADSFATAHPQNRRPYVTVLTGTGL